MRNHLRQLLSDIAQTDPAAHANAGFLQAYAAAHGELEPLSATELSNFRSQVAAEMARAEQRRIPQPQLELVA